MVTTIQIHENVKKELDRLKEQIRGTYEDVILDLIKLTYDNKKRQRTLLVEGYREMSKASLKINKEWSSVDKDWD